MLRTRIVPVLGALLVCASGLVCPARAQDAEEAQAGRLSDVMLPCGVRAALAAIGDRSVPDRSRFLLDVIRRVHHSPPGPKGTRADALPALLAHLERCVDTGDTSVSAGGSSEALPLPLSVPIWTDRIFAGRVAPTNLAAAILESRNASLVYLGLLSLDAPTRGWIAGHPDLLAELIKGRAAAFALVAPSLRVTAGGVDVPGGPPAALVWEALAGRRVAEPAEFLRALLAAEEDHLPYMFGTLGLLTPAQARLALHLDARDPAARLASARRLLAVYAHVGAAWRVELRAFWRPSYDPALLAGDLRVDADGRPVLPGTRRFWTAVLGGGGDGDGDGNGNAIGVEPRVPADGEPVEFAWLCEQVYSGLPLRHRGRHQQVLYASRLLSSVAPEPAREAIEAVRAAERFPALTATLERSGIADVTVIAAAVRRAAQLSAIDGDEREARALAQFQGLLMLLTRAAQRDVLPPPALGALVVSLSAIDPGSTGAYDGRLVRWLATQLQAQGAAGTDDAVVDEEFGAAPIERVLIDLVAGRIAPDTGDAAAAGGAAAAVAAGTGAAPTVEWEGTRYRVDLAAAEASRLERLRGEQARPYLSAARALVAMADALSDSALARDRLRRAAGEFERVAQAVGWTDAELWTRGDARVRSRDLAAALQRAAKEGSAAGAARLAPAVLALADDLFARGLMELAYAVAMGQPEGLGFSADEIAGRHDFGLYAGRVRHRYGPWELPVAAADSKRPWGGTGSLLGLDVAFAPLSLVRLSSRLPRKPTLDEEDRRALIRNVALVRETALSDAQRDTIVAAIHKGRARLAAARTPDEGAAIAKEAILDGPRRSLLPWIVARDPERVAAFLSTGELFRLGLERAPIDARLHAWGAPAEPRLGCLCLQIPDRGVVERAAGRWGTGIFVSAFPDFNLRLAELLAELRMPAPLLRAVLTSATLEFVNGTNSRDSDDRRALVEYLQALTLERLEQYLALLTTGGPLVPLGRTADAAATGTMGVPR